MTEQEKLRGQKVIEEVLMDYFYNSRKDTAVESMSESQFNQVMGWAVKAWE